MKTSVHSRFTRKSLSAMAEGCNRTREARVLCVSPSLRVSFPLPLEFKTATFLLLQTFLCIRLHRLGKPVSSRLCYLLQSDSSRFGPLSTSPSIDVSSKDTMGVQKSSDVDEGDSKV
ncbi:hypothetical protein ACLOJK_041108 [Asimina triloba]